MRCCKIVFYRGCIIYTLASICEPPHLHTWVLANVSALPIWVCVCVLVVVRVVVVVAVTVVVIHCDRTFDSPIMTETEKLFVHLLLIFCAAVQCPVFYWMDDILTDL